MQSGGVNYLVGLVTDAVGSCNATNVEWVGTSILQHLPFIASVFYNATGIPSELHVGGNAYSASRDFGIPSSYETITGDFNGDGKADYGRLGGSYAYWYYSGSTEAPPEDYSSSSASRRISASHRSGKRSSATSTGIPTRRPASRSWTMPAWLTRVRRSLRKREQHVHSRLPKLHRHQQLRLPVVVSGDDRRL